MCHSSQSWWAALFFFLIISSFAGMEMEILVIHQLNIHMLQSLPFSPGQKWSQTVWRIEIFKWLLNMLLKGLVFLFYEERGFFWSSWGRMKQIFALPMWKGLPYWANIIATSVRWMVDDSDVCSPFSFSFLDLLESLSFPKASLFVSYCFHTIQLACI
jgi:hypothetical protein